MHTMGSLSKLVVTVSLHFDFWPTFNFLPVAGSLMSKAATHLHYDFLLRELSKYFRSIRLLASCLIEAF